MEDSIKRLLKSLVTLLVDSKYAEVVAQNRNGRLSESEIEEALKDYPGNITLPPDSAYDRVIIYDIYDKSIDARKIEFDLWYDGEASDLTLSADVHRGKSGEFEISIDDIHVL